jgi:hypothetical protein
MKLTSLNPCKSRNFFCHQASGEKPVYGPMTFAHIGMESLNYTQLQQHMQRQVVCP